MGWFSKKKPSDPSDTSKSGSSDTSRMSDEEIRNAVQRLELDEKTLRELMDPRFMGLLLSRYGYTPETAMQRVQQARPAEVLAEIAQKEPDRSRLYSNIDQVRREFEAIMALLGEDQPTSFVPPGEKEYPEAEAGDVLCGPSPKGGYSLTRIIAKSPIALKSGQSYNLSGQTITAPCDDFFLSVGVSLTDPLFASVQEARTAVSAGTVSWKVMMVPMRPSGLRAGKHELVGNLPADAETLKSYEAWKAMFEAGTAGSF